MKRFFTLDKALCFTFLLFAHILIGQNGSEPIDHLDVIDPKKTISSSQCIPLSYEGSSSLYLGQILVRLNSASTPSGGIYVYAYLGNFNNYVGSKKVGGLSIDPQNGNLYNSGDLSFNIDNSFIPTILSYAPLYGRAFEKDLDISFTLATKINGNFVSLNPSYFTSIHLDAGSHDISKSFRFCVEDLETGDPIPSNPPGPNGNNNQNNGFGFLQYVPNNSNNESQSIGSNHSLRNTEVLNVIDTKNETTATFKAFPNPTVNILSLSYFSRTPSNVTIRIFDLSGRNILTKSESSIEGINKTTLNLEHLVGGIYFCEIQLNNSEKHTIKLFKTK